jgi:hypothetical protein
MHTRASWSETGRRLCLCAAVAVALPIALGAQNQPAVFPGAFGGWSSHTSANRSPAPPAPAAAKPSADVPVSQLPPTPVTQPPAAPPVPATPAQGPAHRATVLYENGQLTVRAYNSSLNQILRAIVRETGLQINGGVVDERVYGVYGPDSLLTVLTSLLVGTGSDTLYLSATADHPAQLTLTSRTGATPPPPSATAGDDLLPDGPGDDSASPTPQLAMQPNPGSQTAPTQPASTGASPATPPTVDQIYQQILQLHMAQQQKAAAAPAAASVPH